MIKNLNALSENENREMFLLGISYAHFSAFKDKELYEDSKSGIINNLSKSQKVEIKVLSLLEKLGYSMDEIGTYLYKDIIVESYNLLKSENNEELLEDLRNPYSSIYVYVAREDKEMGIKTFHLYIEDAIRKIDMNKADKDLYVEIFGLNQEDKDYGTVAYQLAYYVFKSFYLEKIKVM